jgi:hypothetical protein
VRRVHSAPYTTHPAIVEIGLPGLITKENLKSEKSSEQNIFLSGRHAQLFGEIAQGASSPLTPHAD